MKTQFYVVAAAFLSSIAPEIASGSWRITLRARDDDPHKPVLFKPRSSMDSARGGSSMEVLKSAIIHGAEAMGLAQDLGSNKNGKLADLVVLDANPLDAFHNTNTIRYVMMKWRII